MDEAALLQRLHKRQLGGAALDVFEEEPKMNPLFHSLDNVLLTPHIGSGSAETRDRMADLVVANIDAVWAGKEPLTPVVFEG